jgi:aryl-alcohol dehydrogenase-like predicted oxidoreductase
MRYRLLGKSGLRVSEAALGTMTFGDDGGFATTVIMAVRPCSRRKRRNR